jgi:hypothetical protein
LIWTFFFFFLLPSFLAGVNVCVCVVYEDPLASLSPTPPCALPSSAHSTPIPSLCVLFRLGATPVKDGKPPREEEEGGEDVLHLPNYSTTLLFFSFFFLLSV